MKQADYLNAKVNFDIRKRPINGKLFQNQKTMKDEFILNTKKTMGKKYMQQPNIFKQKQDQPKKQHRQIIMSEQFIRSSKLYRLLKQKMDRCDSMFIKQVNSMNEHKMKLKEEIMQARSENYQQKVSLWELKNKLMELKIMYHEEQEESKRLAEQNYGEYEGEQEYEGQEGQQNGEQNIEQEEQDQQGNTQNQEGYTQINRQQNGLMSPVNQIISDQDQGQQKNQVQQDKNQFSQILQQLMNLKAERKKIEKQFSEESLNQVKHQKQEKSEVLSQQEEKCSFNDQIQYYPQ